MKESVSKESVSLRFLYRTALGRMILKVLVLPPVSKAAGVFLDSKLSCFLVRPFMNKNKITLQGIEVPKGGFPSFNAFFCRKKKQSVLQGEKGVLISPCDAFLRYIPIEEDTVCEVKHTAFTLKELLKDSELAKEFSGGGILVFRLTPSHYHRYCYASNGKIQKSRRIRGVLHCVRPIATEKFPVYAQNAREYQLIETESFGKIIQMEIGALFVGRINNLKRQKKTVWSGEEKGYFEFGGSTILLLVQKDRLRMEGLLKKAYECPEEISVKQGMKIAAVETDVE